MFFDTPDWASRHKYLHHSNPRSGDRSKKLFEKVHIRPSIEWARYVLKDETRADDHSLAGKILYNFTVGRSSAAMEAGRAVQDACDLHLLPDPEYGQTLSLSEATEVALKTLQEYKPKDYSQAALDDDRARKEKYLEEMPGVIEHAVLGLREAMRSDNRMIGEIDLIDKLPGNALPHFTKPDYGRRGDLKTKWSRPTKRQADKTKPFHPTKNQVWTDVKPPKTLGKDNPFSFDMNNVYQACGFWALNGRQPPFIVYASSTDYKVFTPNNAPELKDDFLEEVLQDIIKQHSVTENILRSCHNKYELFDFLDPPDFSKLHWKEPPGYIAEARKMWGLNDTA